MAFPRISAILSSPAPLFKWMSTRLTNDLLLGIAHLDHGYDADEHLAALKAIRNGGEIAGPLTWVPREVLSLALSISAGQTAYPEAAPIAPQEAHLVNAFACAVLLHDAREGNTHSNDAGNIELCRLLTALASLGPDALTAGLSFVAWIGEGWPGGRDSRAFFAVALVWLALRTGARIADEEVSRVIAFAIEEEAEQLAVRGKALGPHPEHWLIGTTVYGHAKKCWQRIGSDLRGDAHALLSDTVRAQVLHLADLLVLGRPLDWR